MKFRIKILLKIIIILNVNVKCIEEEYCLKKLDKGLDLFFYKMKM